MHARATSQLPSLTTYTHALAQLTHATLSFLTNRNKLEEVRLLHKLRKKAGGTNAQTLMEGGRDELHEPQALQPLAEEGRNELLGAFSKAQMRETTDEDPHM